MNNKEYETLLKQIEISSNIQNTLISPGWDDIILPILKNKIFEITGGEKDGVFIRGQIESDNLSQEKILYHIGQKDAIIDFLNELGFIVKQGKLAEKKLEKLRKKQ